MQYAVFNDSIIPINDLNVHVSDLAIHRAYGVFDFFKLKNGENPWLDWYMERFYRSMSETLLKIEWPATDLKEMVRTLVTKNDSPNSCIKLLCTGGLSSDGFTPRSKPNFFMLNYPSKAPPEKAYAEGVKLLCRPYRRTMPSVKSIDYFYSITLIPELQRAGAIDVLYHLNGLVSETSRSNIFIVKDGKISTPRDHVLQGITRRRVLEASLPFQTTEEEVRLESLYSADEVFVTSTTKAALPVVQVDDRIIGDGKPGRVTRALTQLIRSF